ncbi:MAG: hypothetical protein MZW92_23305 [Comamonadaceae bacterium]|nr:hypothetical protein [Comamonadaceae bacterium]
MVAPARPRTRCSGWRRVCARHRVPLTVRGGGTGNYGQCVPLHGGIVVDATGAEPRAATSSPAGAASRPARCMHDLNLAARASGQQLRMWPSTERVATRRRLHRRRAFGGIGSHPRTASWPTRGNVRRLPHRHAARTRRGCSTCVGADIQQAHHAYGSNGIITEVEVALDRRRRLAAHDRALRPATTAGAATSAWRAASTSPRIDAVPAVGGGAPHHAVLRRRCSDRSRTIADAMFAHGRAGHAAGLRGAGAGAWAARCRWSMARDRAAGRTACRRPTECAYNHTTLQALKADRGVDLPAGGLPAALGRRTLVVAQMQRFGDEAAASPGVQPLHGGEPWPSRCRWCTSFDAAQLRELIRELRGRRLLRSSTRTPVCSRTAA